MPENDSSSNGIVRNKNIFDYPSQSELELIILKLSPCSISDILRDKGLPINSGTLTTMKKRIEYLENEDKIKIRRFKKLWVCYPKFFEEVRDKELKKRLSAMGFLER